MKPCVWLRMENRVFRKIIYFDRKIAPLTRKIFSSSILLSNHFRRHAKRERERERERTHRRANRERKREIGPSSLRSHWLDHHPCPLHATVRSRHEPTNWSTHLVHWRDHTTNPWTDRRPRPLHATVRSRHEPTNPQIDRPTSSIDEIAPRTHEPIDPSLILTDEPTNRSCHDWSYDFDFFCFDFCFLCCLYASIICNNICLDPKKMWETW